MIYCKNCGYYRRLPDADLGAVGVCRVTLPAWADARPGVTINCNGHAMLKDGQRADLCPLYADEEAAND